MAERDTHSSVYQLSLQKRDVPVLPEKLKHKETNDILAYMAQRLPFKASMNIAVDADMITI